MFRLSLPRAALCAGAIAVASLAGACSSSEPREPAVATPTVTVNHDRAPAGSPLDITYKFVVAEGASFAEDYRVFAHVVDTDEERMWDDDHNPPIPTSQWKPGQTIEYTRTVFVPIFPYVGEATLRVGLHSVKDQRRLALSGEDLGQRAYRVARFQLLPQTENLLLVHKDGWHPAEIAPINAAVEWTWTKKQATLAFKNPKKDAVLYLELDSPTPEYHGPQAVRVMMGGQVLEEFTLAPTDRLLKKVKLPASQMGDGDLSELQIVVDKTFVPAQVSGGSSKDPRELGVRVFHAFVDPR